MIPPNIDIIKEAVAKVYGVRPSELDGPSRSKSIIQARQVGMYLLREVYQASYPEIGKAFKRHHTTVISDVRKAIALRASNKLVAARLAAIAEELLAESPETPLDASALQSAPLPRPALPDVPDLFP